MNIQACRVSLEYFLSKLDFGSMVRKAAIERKKPFCVRPSWVINVLRKLNQLLFFCWFGRSRSSSSTVFLLKAWCKQWLSCMSHKRLFMLVHTEAELKFWAAIVFRNHVWGKTTAWAVAVSNHVRLRTISDSMCRRLTVCFDVLATLYGFTYTKQLPHQQLPP